MTSDCPVADTSQRNQPEGPQTEPDNVTDVCVFSTGNHCESFQADQEQKKQKTLSCSQDSMQPIFMTVKMITLVTKQVVRRTGPHVTNVQQRVEHLEALF